MKIHPVNNLTIFIRLSLMEEVKIFHMLAQKCKYSDINTTEQTTLGFSIAKYLSDTPTLYEDTSTDSQ